MVSVLGLAGLFYPGLNSSLRTVGLAIVNHV
jgi:hypothetical protein